jgi:uncharacterized protein
MLTIHDFRPVSLQDRDLFKAQYERYPQVHSDNTLVNMLCWNHYANYRYAHVDGSIIISSTIDGKTTFRAPIGPRNKDLLDEVLELARASKNSIPFIIMDPDTKAWVEEIYPDLPLHADRDFSDYVYRTSDLAELPGKEYLTIRHHLNRFRREYSYTTEPITRENIDEVREFLLVWCEWKDCDSVPILAYEKDAIIYATDHFFDLGLWGLIVRIEGTIGAISVVGPQNVTTSVVHFEKALPDTYRGIYRVINAETADKLKGQYLCINRECDMGVLGLRESKTRYHPHHLVEVYYATLDDINAILP